jgi:pyruvate kinase
MDHYQSQHGQFGFADFDEFADLIEPDRKAISRSVKTLAKELNIQGILVPTNSGATAIVLSADRPCAPLIGVSCNEKVCRRLALNWGVIPILIEEKTTHDWQELCNEVSAKNGLAKIGNRILLVSGFNHDPLLNEPVIKLLRVKAMRDSD